MLDIEEENELLPSSEALWAPAPDPGEGLLTPAAGPNTYIGPTSSKRSLATPSEHVGLQSHHEQVLSRGLVCVCNELQSCCEHAASALIVHPQQRTCLRVRRAAVMLRACCECFDCASAGADVAPDATVRALTDRNDQRMDVRGEHR